MAFPLPRKERDLRGSARKLSQTRVVGGRDENKTGAVTAVVDKWVN